MTLLDFFFFFFLLLHLPITHPLIRRSPGFGIHSPVPHQHRIAACLAATTAILSHLNVKRIALLSASAGVLYLFNTVAPLRSLLHPRHPYISAMVPWVHPKYSHSKLLDTASRLPEPLISSFGGVQKFMVNNIVPTVSWSGGLIEQVGSLFRSSDGSDREDADSRETYLRCFGVSEAFKDEAEKAAIKYVFTEGS